MSVKATIPDMTAMTISFWMRTQQESEGTVLSYATQNQPEELVIQTHHSVGVILKGSSQESYLRLNDGNWHFLWIEWESSTGLVVVREGNLTIRFNYPKEKLEGGGYLVLGQRQKSQKVFFEAKAFVGEISHVNIWDVKKTDLDFAAIRIDCIGLYSGSIFHLSDDSIDTRHSASIIEADMCPGVIFSLLTWFIYGPFSW